MPSKIDRAEFWLEKGYKLLPCQPDTKMLVGGFGQYRAQIKDATSAAQWFGVGGKSNLAVLAPENNFILDFDLIGVYVSWVAACPAAARSYTETTPSGGRHVWMIGDIPAGIKLVKGAEIKRVVIVAPSVVNGQSYKISQDHDILKVDAVQVLTPLSEIGHATPYAQRATETRRAVRNPLSRIEQIKDHFRISYVLNSYHPEINISDEKNGIKACRCPLENHSKSKAPFFFSDTKGLWKCHACELSGDVINLYAHFEGINLRDAISRMWASMAVRS